MKDFMYIFRGLQMNEEAFASQSPEQMQEELKSWNTWMGGLIQKGKLIGGQPLSPAGRVLRGIQKKVTDGPFTEGKDIVGGYLLIKANDFDEAVELSKGCPYLEVADGSVEVREVLPLPH